MAWTQDKINEVYVKVQNMAATDEEFREELLNDSNAAIAKIAGEDLPEDFKVKIIENDPQYAATFILPPMVSDELSGDELDGVAGGICGIDGAPCGAFVCAAKGEADVCGAKAGK